MPVAPSEPVKRRRSVLLMIGGTAAVIDTLWGIGLISFGFDFHRLDEALAALTLVSGIPAFLLDLWSGSRVALFLIALFLARWDALCLGPPSSGSCRPWGFTVFIVVAYVCVQIWKLKKNAPRSPSLS